MAKNDVYCYIVEGECEIHSLSFLKNRYVKAGRVMKLNPVQEEISLMRLRTFKENTIVVLIFDTDTNDGMNILKKNIKILESSKRIKEIILVPQVKNFEDELIRASSIKSIKEFTKSKSNSDFKRDFLANRNLEHLFSINKFNMKKFWIGVPTGLYKSINNESYKILII